MHSVLQAHSGALVRGDGAKRGSRASDTSSAYSGSDMMQSSLGEDETVDMSALAENLDSDDEEGYVESPDVSLCSRFETFTLRGDILFASMRLECCRRTVLVTFTAF